MVKRVRKMTPSNISSIVADLDRWAIGQFGSKLTWADLESRFGFTRQALQARSEIKAAYDFAKKSLGSGLIQSRQETSNLNQELQCENERLKIELAEHKRREELWKKRWQRIAFHIRQKGIQVYQVDKEVAEEINLPTERETNRILAPFDKDIPFSGRI